MRFSTESVLAGRSLSSNLRSNHQLLVFFLTSFFQQASSSRRDEMYIERSVEEILLAPEERNGSSRPFITGNIALRWSASRTVNSGAYKRNMKGVPLGDKFRVAKAETNYRKENPDEQAQVCSNGRG
jgi:hypothetical protein